MKTSHTTLETRGLMGENAQKPLIGIVTVRMPSQNTEILEGLLQSAEKGVLSAGGLTTRLTFEAADLGTAWGHGLKHLLPRRDLLSDELECLAAEAGLQGLVLFAPTQETAAGLLMGAVRGRLPAVLIGAGRARPGPGANGHARSAPRPPTLQEALAGLLRPDGKLKKNKGAKGSASLPQGFVASDDGSYASHGLMLVAEALGVSLPGSSTLVWDDPRRFELAHQAGARLAEMAVQGLAINRILTPAAFANAVLLDAALGGSADVWLHLLALAQDCGVRLGLDAFEKAHKGTPPVADLRGEARGSHGVAELDRAGGVPAVLSILRASLQAAPTMTGKNLTELIRGCSPRDPRVIRSKPARKCSGFSVISGNLAPGGAVAHAGTEKLFSLPVHGPARVFDSEESAVSAVKAKRFKKGEILVLRYQGPAGGPGLPPLHVLPAALKAYGLAEILPVVTDGRLADSEDGLRVSLVSPEAASGGPLALLKDGDQIEINIPARRITARLTDTELRVRHVRWRAPERKNLGVFMSRYAKRVAGANQGAVVR